MPQTSLIHFEALSAIDPGAASHGAAAGNSDASRDAVFSASSMRPAGPFPAGPLPRAVDSDPRNLNFIQLATLQAVFSLFVRPASSDLPSRPDASVSQTPRFSPPPPIAFDYRLALDELGSICRARAGYAFIQLPLDLQYAVVNLIFSRDLISPKIDLALWLEVLRRNPPVASL